MSNEGFSRGPIRRLKEGITRYSLVYRVKQGSSWKLFQMTKIAHEGTEHRVASELHARLAQKLMPFEIIDVKDLGDEIPLDPGMDVVSQEHYDSIKESERNKYYDEIERGAKDRGIWVPGQKEH
jgi:hypothetical protein